MAHADPPRTLIPQERKDGTWFVKAEKLDAPSPPATVPPIAALMGLAESDSAAHYLVERASR